MKIAIIGGGIGGITAALYLTADGHDVTIYERSDRLGGRIDYAQESEFKVDKGPTIVLLPQMIKQILSEAGVADDAIDMVRCDPLYRIHYFDGTTFDKYSNTEKQLAEIRRVFPGEEQHFLDYMEEMSWRYTKGKKAFLDKPFVRKRDFWTIANLVTLRKLKAHLNMKKDANSFFKHPQLQEAFSFQSLYIGGNPHQTPALYSLIPYAEHEFGIWYVRGGYASMIPKLESILLERDARVYLKTEISKLAIENGVCTGIMLGSKKKSYDHVIINGDFPMTSSLLSRKLAKRPLKKYQASSGCLLVYLGLNRRYDDAQIHQFFLGADSDSMYRDIFKQRKIPMFPSVYVFNPSIVDDTLAPEGKSVLYLLIPVPSGKHISWDFIADDLADFAIDEVERRGFPDLRASIEWKQIRTPKQAMKEGLYQGGSFGLAPTLSQSGVFRPQIDPHGIKNLYAVGASIHPGGGVPIVMQGAKMLFEYMKEQGLD